MKKIIFVTLLFAASLSMRAQDIAVSTNFIDYASLGTINLEASYGLAQHWSINAGVKYNPFSYNSSKESIRLKQRQIYAGTRYWPWHIFSGWWMSGLVGYQEYNEGGLVSAQTSEGDRFGAGVGVGYTYMLSSHLNIDFGLGIWAGYDEYITYSCASCGRVLGEGGKFFFRPSNIMIALAYIF